MPEKSDRYAQIGFMCGLEIHQRLNTERKLFCKCKTKLGAEQKETGIVERYQRAVAGELGKLDKSTEFESMRRRKFIYHIYDSATCLVDLDEEPPHDINQDALATALSMAHALRMRIPDEIQTMRKGVVDGSDPSAFQRTALVGMDGEVSIGGNRIRITLMSLEEESSGIIENTETYAAYATDRLGVPLIEIDTDANIASPAQAKELALHLGTLLRLTGKVQRGIGSIRQDVNVSIKGGARTEMKGFQEVDNIDKFIENEILRQQKLLEIRDELRKRKARVDKPVDVTKVFAGSKAKIISDQLRNNGTVLAFRLEGFKGLLGMEVNPSRRLGTEISDYAKIAGLKGIIHSDESMDSYGITEAEITELGKEIGMRAGTQDAFIILAGPRQKVESAAAIAADRAGYAIVGVPVETRAVANADAFTTRFLRPLPGGSRMYPETDIVPTRVTKAMLDKAEKEAPNLEKELKELEEQVGDRQLAERLAMSYRLPLYRHIAKNSKADPAFIANTLLQKFTELKRMGMDVDSIGAERLSDIFIEYKKGAITKQAVEEIVKWMSRSQDGAKEIISKNSLGRITGKELEDIIKEVEKSKLAAGGKDFLKKEIMSKYRFRIDGSELNKLLPQ